MLHSVSSEYFTDKVTHSRREVSDVSGKAFEAVEIATQVLRLCYPLRPVSAVRTYYDNTPIEPFLNAEHSSLSDAESSMAVPIPSYTVVDVNFLFGGAYVSRGENDAFAVEVAFPADAKRVRWQTIIRVRWADLSWGRLGNHHGDLPVPELVGETFVNTWF